MHTISVELSKDLVATVDLKMEAKSVFGESFTINKEGDNIEKFYFFVPSELKPYVIPVTNACLDFLNIPAQATMEMTIVGEALCIKTLKGCKNEVELVMEAIADVKFESSEENEEELELDLPVSMMSLGGEENDER